MKSPDELKKIDRKVEAKVKGKPAFTTHQSHSTLLEIDEFFSTEIIDKLKINHEKFDDPDFGPTEKDEFGAASLYGSGTPNPAGKECILFLILKLHDRRFLPLVRRDLLFVFLLLLMFSYEFNLKLQDLSVVISVIIMLPVPMRTHE